ncbi:DUF2868 domain-containing protein [Mariniblastus sp.]|nr:DUF2868 domain-containing protein [Mariniblastus sp.]
MLSSTQNNFNSKLELSDVVLIELMEADEGFSDFDANIDLNVDAVVRRKYSADSKTWFPRLIAERAALYRQQKHDAAPEDLRLYLRKLLAMLVTATIAILMLLFVLNFLSVPKQLFASADNEANIVELVWFTAIPLCFGLFALLFSILLLRRSKGTQNSGSFTWKLISVCSVPGVIGLCWNGWRTLRGKDPSASEVALQEFARNKGRAAAVCFLAISNILVLVLSLAALFSLAYFLLFNEVGFTWKSSLATEQNKKSLLGLTCSLPFVDAPVDEAIRWANGATGPVISENATNSPEDGLPVYSRDKLDTFRNQWSWFLLKAMFVAGIIPRLLVALVSFFLVRSVWEELLPKPSDSELAKIAAGVISPPIVSKTETEVQELGSSQIAESSVVDELSSSATKTQNEQTPKQTYLVGYQLRPESVELISGQFQDGNVKCEHVSGAKSRFELLESLKSSNLLAVTLFVRASVVPDLAFESFVQKVHALCIEQNAQTKTILLDSNAFLESVSGDVDVLQQRVAQWKKSLVNARVDLNQLIVADLGSASGIDQIRQHFNGSPGTDLPASDVKMAGRFATSLDLIKKKLFDACHSDSTLSSEDWNRVCEGLRDRVAQIYEREYSSFLDSINNPTNSGFEASIASGFQQIKPLENFDSSFDVVKDSLGKLKMLEGYFKNLSPKWMVAGAIAGVGATAALPLLVGGVTAAPLIVTALPYVGLSGAGIGQSLKSFLTGSTNDSSGDQPANEGGAFAGLNLDIVTRSMVLLVLFLEYQEYPQESSAKKIKEHTDSCGDVIVDSYSKLVMFVDCINGCLQRDLEAAQ